MLNRVEVLEHNLKRLKMCGVEFRLLDKEAGIVEICDIREGSESLIIPEGVVEIRKSKQLKCKETLRNIKKVSLPETLKVIGPRVFEGFESLVNIKWPKGLERIESRAFCYSLKRTELDLGSTGIKSLVGYCFAGCVFESIKFPNTLKYLGILGESAFSEDMAELDLRNTMIKTFNTNSIEYCSNFRVIRLPGSVKKIVVDGLGKGCNPDIITIAGGDKVCLDSYLWEEFASSTTKENFIKNAMENTRIIKE